MRNFGMPHPEGYRKALRVARLAEKFEIPVIFFIDTPGAYPGVGAEERGQSEAIARNLFELSELKTRTIAIVIGEGGSGGALAIGVADRLAMMRNSCDILVKKRSLDWFNSSICFFSFFSYSSEALSFNFDE